MRFTCGALAFLIALISAGAAGAQAVAKTGVAKASYGKLDDGTEVELYTLTNVNGVAAKVITYGGIITELWVPDKEFKFADVVLGKNDLKGYAAGHPYFGAITGRVANRIAKGKFTLEGKEYTLATNNGPNHLHGGKKGFDKVVWKAAVENANVPVLRLSYTSKDGEEGYPGNLSCTVTYSITDQNALRIDYVATTDKATPLNLTNHSYFNLAGQGQSDILGHDIEIFADKYTPTDDTLIPTGKIEPVKATPYDLTKPTPIGKHLGEIKGDPGGYDINYVLRDQRPMKMAARVVEPKSGRVMDVQTTEPGVQFYSGNFLDGKDQGKGKEGSVYKKHAGFCLETQHYPDSINHPEFPSTVLKPGASYRSTTIYAFSVK
jgi:aldose 1-epimerase